MQNPKAGELRRLEQSLREKVLGLERERAESLVLQERLRGEAETVNADREKEAGW